MLEWYVSPTRVLHFPPSLWRGRVWFALVSMAVKFEETKDRHDSLLLLHVVGVGCVSRSDVWFLLRCNMYYLR